jgi:hypothetical protein
MHYKKSYRLQPVTMQLNVYNMDTCHKNDGLNL